MTKILKLKIDGSWEPQDFIEVIQSVESFYYKLIQIKSHSFRHSWLLFERDYYISGSIVHGRVGYNEALDNVNLNLLHMARSTISYEKRLNISRIQYASPGGIDFLGVGKVVETIVKAVGDFAVYRDEAPLRKERLKQAKLDTELKSLEVDKEKENLQSLKIKNARESLELFNANPQQLEALLPLLVRDQDALASRVTEKKLISASLVSSDQEHS